MPSIINTVPNNCSPIYSVISVGVISLMKINVTIILLFSNLYLILINVKAFLIYSITTLREGDTIKYRCCDAMS